MAAKQSAAMDKAERLVKKDRMSPPDAARKAGVAVQSVYRSAWYREIKGLEPLAKKGK